MKKGVNLFERCNSLFFRSLQEESALIKMQTLVIFLFQL